MPRGGIVGEHGVGGAFGATLRVGIRSRRSGSDRHGREQYHIARRDSRGGVSGGGEGAFALVGIER